MFSIPSAAALGLCRPCGSVIRSVWKPTASPALPVGGSVEGAALTGESRGQSSLVGCSPWGRKELDMTEQLSFSLMIYSLKQNSMKYIYHNKNL